MIYTLCGILFAWLGTTLLFIVIPTYTGLTREVRAARAAGIANAEAVVRERFFLPRASRPLHASLVDRVAWVETFDYPAHRSRALRVTAVLPGSLTLEDGQVFEPARASRTFADGRGAAKGTMRSGDETVPALVIFA